MTWVLRDQIDPGNVGKIIDAVRHGYKRRKVQIPADIDGLSLRRDIDRAIAGYRAFVDTSPKQPRKERSDHLRRQNRKIEDLIDSIEGDGPAAWVRNQIARRGHDEKPLAPPVIGHLRSFMGQLRRLQSDASGAKLDLGDSPESALQWLVGERLANIFERHFQIRPKAGRSSRNINQNGIERHYPIGSAFTAFVIAVCKEAGISPISPPTVADLLSRQRRRSTTA